MPGQKFFGSKKKSYPGKRGHMV